MTASSSCEFRMLALSDENLARLCIAASAIPRNRRRQWLRELANELEPPRRSQGARYTAAWRAREKAGRCLLTLEVDEAELVVALVDAGLLDFSAADDRAALTEATQRALALYLAGEGSRRDERICDTVRAELGLTALQKALPHVSKKRFRK
jgi:hypothetical protein